MSNSAETSTSNPNSKPPLHNFSLPPSLKWGTQKILRCSKHPSSRSDPSIRSSEYDAVRSSVVDHDAQCHGSPAATAARPWNLRTRRVGNPSASGQGRSWEFEKRDKLGSPNGKMMKLKTVKRKLFSIALSKEEIELDFLKLFGTRPPRRPKKRPRILQRQVDFVCPGLWLTEITADRYKVSDFPEPLKCRVRCLYSLSSKKIEYEKRKLQQLIFLVCEIMQLLAM